MVLTTWLRRQILFRGQQQVDHQLDDLARGEVLPGLLVRLLRPDPDQLFEDIAHLHVVHSFQGQIDPRQMP